MCVYIYIYIYIYIYSPPHGTRGGEGEFIFIDSKLPGNVRDGPQGKNRSALFK